MNAAHLEYLLGVKERLEGLPKGQRGQVVTSAAAWLGIKAQTVYARLKELGWESGRKKRTDCGATTITRATAELAAGIIKTATRANGKKTLPLSATTGILQENGLAAAAPATMARAMKRYGCHPRQVKRGTTAMSMKSLHPNHVWQMDASICTLFYLKENGTQDMDESIFYKNKPHNLEKIAARRVIRWIVADHFSGAFFLRYTLGAEDAQNALEVLIQCMCQRGANDLLHGVPSIFYTDKGAPFVAKMTQNFLKRLGVEQITHAAGNSKATGLVEVHQNIVETQFEGRFRFKDAFTSLEELNAYADAWRIAFNANFIHSRHGRTRNAFWLTIKPEQLRVPESVETLKAVVQQQPEPRKVPPTLILKFAPKGFKSMEYSLSHIDGLVVSQDIMVAVNPFEAPAVDVIVTSPEGVETIYTLQPIKKDRGGFNEDAQPFGEGMRTAPDTVTDKAVKRMEMEAYGASSLEEAAKAKKAGQKAYAGVDIDADISASKPHTYLPARGVPINLERPEREIAPLSHVGAAMQLRPMLAEQGVRWGAEHMAHLQEKYPQGVPVQEIETLAANFVEQAKPAKRLSFEAEAKRKTA